MISHLCWSIFMGLGLKPDGHGNGGQCFMQDENVACHDLGKVSFERAVGCFGKLQLEARDSFPNAPTRARDLFSECSKSSLRLAFECSNLIILFNY